MNAAPIVELPPGFYVLYGVHGWAWGRGGRIGGDSYPTAEAATAAAVEHWNEQQDVTP